MEINVRSAPIQPEVPKVLDNEQINVYVPFATTLYAGIASYDFKHFEFKLPGQVSLDPLITETLNYVRRTIDPSENNGALYQAEGSYKNRLLNTDNQTVIGGINEHHNVIGKGVNPNTPYGVETPNPDYVDSDDKETGIIGLANGNKRWLIDMANLIGNQQLSTSDKTLTGGINELQTAVVTNTNKVQSHETIISKHSTQIEANKNAISVNKNAIAANAALSASNKTRIDAIDAQVKSIARTFAVKTFGEFIQFINGNISVPLYEDRNADGATEAYSVTVGDLITGDSVLIVEEEVPDFWFEKTTDVSGAGTYLYNGTEYSLAATQGNKNVGIWYATETDLSEVKEAAEIAVAAADRAEENADKTEELLTEYIDEVDDLIDGDGLGNGGSVQQTAEVYVLTSDLSIQTLTGAFWLLSELMDGNISNGNGTEPTIHYKLVESLPALPELSIKDDFLNGLLEIEMSGGEGDWELPCFVLKSTGEPYVAVVNEEFANEMGLSVGVISVSTVLPLLGFEAVPYNGTVSTPEEVAQKAEAGVYTVITGGSGNIPTCGGVSLKLLASDVSGVAITANDGAIVSFDTGVDLSTKEFLIVKLKTNEATYTLPLMRGSFSPACIAMMSSGIGDDNYIAFEAFTESEFPKSIFVTCHSMPSRTGIAAAAVQLFNPTITVYSLE